MSLSSLWLKLKGLLASIAARLVVMPSLLRGICIILLSSIPGVFALAIWVLPAYRQGVSIAEQATEIVSTLEGQRASESVQHRIDVESRRQVLQRYPVWYSDQAWLQGLVGLAKSLGVSTQGLKHTGTGPREDPDVVNAMRTLRVDNNTIGHLEQRGYEWRMTGSHADISRLLGHLASRSLWVDALDVRSMVARSAQSRGSQAILNAPGVAEPAAVSAVLTFRQSARILPEIKPAQVASSSEYAFEPEHRAPVPLPAFERLFASANHSCTAENHGNPRLAESVKVFADQALDQISLVGVIERAGEKGRVVRRAVFRGAKGSLVVAAQNAEIASRGFRLVELDKDHGVLYSEDEGSTVMMLEPVLMAAVDNPRHSTSATRDHE